MRNERLKTSKYNAALTEALFELMFETLWIPAYDRRHDNPMLCEFDRTARRLAVLLSDTDLTDTSAERMPEIRPLSEKCRNYFTIL